MTKELEEIFKRLDLFKLEMNKNVEDIYNRLYVTFDDNEISYLLDYIEELKQENKQLKEEISKISKKELKIMQMLRSIELCTLTKERIDQIEEVMFELGW